MPVVSAIIPVYNAGKYLGECLDSILGQTLRDIEVFCIDDGSTDETAAILADRAAKDPRVRLMSTNRQGPYIARRKALEAATGRYVHFMDADDAIANEAYAELSALCDRESLDQVVFGAEVFTDGHVRDEKRLCARFNKSYTVDPSLDGRIMSGAELFRALCEAECFSPGPPLRLIRRTVLTERECPFPDSRFHGDNFLTPASLYNSRRACALACKYYRRRVREGSMTTAEGVSEFHFKGMLNSVAALCAFPPFAEDARSGHPAAVWYLARLHRSLAIKAKALPDGALDRLCCEAEGAEIAAFFRAGSLPVVRALERRPASVRGCLRYILRRLVGRR